MRILWHSTAGWGPSSYSVLTARVTPDLVRAGHEVAVSTWYGLQGAPQRQIIRQRNDPKGPPAGAIMTFPTVDGPEYGRNTVGQIYQRIQADVLITCMDLWVLPPQLLSQMKVAPWLPVDHDPCPDGIRASAAACLYPMAFTAWGRDVLQAAGIDAHYVPCSGDSGLYLPMDRKMARERVGIPATCDFLATMVAANKDPSDRKGFGEALQGFARFAQGHPNAMLYIHTNWAGPVSIHKLVERCGLGGKVALPDQLDYALGMFTDEQMRQLYAASDVLLNPAKSEGFGLPLIEAQMCGTPIAATDFSTTRELMSAGWLIDGQQHWSIGADSWRLLANVDSVAAALEEAYREKDNETLKKQARAGAIRYDTERVFKEHWQPALKTIEDLVTEKPGGKLQLVTF